MDFKKLALEFKWGFSDFTTNEKGRKKGPVQVYELNASRDASL